MAETAKPWLWRGCAFLGALAVLFSIYKLYSPAASSAAVSQPERPGDWVPVKRGDFEVLCREEGELKPVKVTAMSFLRWGKISFIVPEGTYVKKGERVVSLETKDLEEEVARGQDDLAVAERNLFQQEQTRDLDVKRLKGDLQTERERDEFAALKEKELLGKPLPVDREEAENQLAGAKARLANAQADLEAYKPLAEKGFGRGADVKAKELAVAKARVELERAEMKYRTTMRGADEYDRAKARLDRENTARTLAIKEIDVQDQIASLETKVYNAQRAVEHLKRKLDRKKLDLERSSLYAPHDGLVVYRTMEWRGNKKVEIGEYVGPWLSPCDLPNYEKMKVRTQVPESFINKLKVRQVAEPGAESVSKRGTGSKARVVVKTLPDRVYNAEVTWVDGWARDRNSKLSDADIKAQGLSGVRVFDVEVELEESDPDRLREGFRATVDFPVETHPNVISIPISAVTNRNGQTYVDVRKDGKVEPRQVELGLQSLDKVIVTANLNEGEEIFVPRSLQQATPQKKARTDDETEAPPARRPGNVMGSIPNGPGAGMGGGMGATEGSGERPSRRTMRMEGEVPPGAGGGSGRRGGGRRSP